MQNSLYLKAALRQCRFFLYAKGGLGFEMGHLKNAAIQ